MVEILFKPFVKVALIVYVVKTLRLQQSLPSWNLSFVLPKRSKSEQETKREKVWAKIYKIKAANAALKRYSTAEKEKKTKIVLNQEKTKNRHSSIPKRAEIKKTNKPDQVPNKTEKMRNKPKNPPTQSTFCQPVSSAVTRHDDAMAATPPPPVRPFPNAWTSSQTNNSGSILFPCLHIPLLPQSEQAERTLKRLAKEFCPIIRNRGYNVVLLSELCCCADGTTATTHGHNNPNRNKTTMKIADEDQLLGYNQQISRNGRQCYEIHVRMRNQANHYQFLPYDALADTMCHELAHCVYNDHGQEFWNLFQDIKVEYQLVISSGTVQLSSEELFGDFDIYGSSTSGLGGT